MSKTVATSETSCMAGHGLHPSDEEKRIDLESLIREDFERCHPDDTPLTTSRNVRRFPKKIRACYGTGWRSLPTAPKLIGSAAPNLTPSSRLSGPHLARALALSLPSPARNGPRECQDRRATQGEPGANGPRDRQRLRAEPAAQDISDTANADCHPCA
jgi:hypothetical protein